MTLGSAATVWPCLMLSMIHSVSEGTSFSPLLISHQLQSNSSTACRKYLPSVHSNCEFAVTTAVPVNNQKKNSQVCIEFSVPTRITACNVCAQQVFIKWWPNASETNFWGYRCIWDCCRSAVVCPWLIRFMTLRYRHTVKSQTSDV